MRLLIVSTLLVWCVYHSNAQGDGPVPPRAIISGAVPLRPPGIPGAIPLPVRGGRQGRLLGAPAVRRPAPPNGFYRANPGGASLPPPPPSYAQSIPSAKPVTEDIDEDDFDDKNEEIEAQIAQKQALLSQLPSLSEIGPPSVPVQFRPEPRPLPVARAQQIRPQGEPVRAPQPAVPQRQRIPRPQPAEQSAPQRAYVSQQQQNVRGDKRPVAQILRKYNDENPDGSITWGYENDDGSFKEETIGVDCITRGKYGYVDPDGVRREYAYETGLPCDTVPEEEPQAIIPQQGPRRPITIQNALRPL